eukprot:3652881-Karenia_brevis.AAC.1
MSGRGRRSRHQRDSYRSMITKLACIEIVGRWKHWLTYAAVSGCPSRYRPKHSVNSRFKVAFAAVMGKFGSI